MAACKKGRRPASVIPVVLPLLLSTTGAAPDFEPGREALLDRVIRLAEIAEREVLTEDHCLFSPAGVVLRVGREPAALAAFVRERIGYEPYLGVVRGAEGALATGSAGDWDRAVLLQALLAEAGYASRFRVVERTESERAAAVDLFLAQPRVAADPGESTRASSGEVAARAGLELHNRQLHASARAARWRRLRDEAYDAAAGCLPMLEGALASGGDAGVRGFDARRRALMEGAPERVLVVLEDGAVLDPGPVTTPADPGGPVLEAVPEDRLATFTLMLRMEVTGEGAPDEPVELMHRSFRVGELLGRPLRFQISPDGSEAGDAPPNEWTEEQWRAFLRSVKRFQAILEVDRLWMASDAFDRFGRTFEVGGDGRIEGASNVGGAVGRGFGGFGGDRPARDEEPTTRIAALVLQLDLALPGRATASTQRYLWGDLRRDVSPVYHTDMLVFGGPVPPLHSVWQGLEAFTRNARYLRRLVTSDDRYRMTRTEDVRVVSQMLQEWQLARLDLAEGVVAGDPRLTILGGPAVVMQTTFLLPDAPSPGISRRVVIDVVHDGVRIVPRDAAGAEAAVRGNLLVGAASTVFESLALRERIPAARIEGTYAEFERSRATGGKLASVRLPDLGALAIAPRTRWALERGAAGTICLVPAAAGASSWWQIDPATGATVGRGDDGAGQSAAEYQAALKTAMKNLKCGVTMMGGMMSGKSRGDQAYDFFACITGVDPKDPASWAQTGVGTYTGYLGTRPNIEHWADEGEALLQVADMWCMAVDGMVAVAKYEKGQNGK